MDTSGQGSRLIGGAAFFVAVLCVIGSAVGFASIIHQATAWTDEWKTIFKDHFAAIIGLPSAATAAFALVIFLRQAEGPLDFEVGVFKFKGASGQLVLWVSVFSL